MKKKVSLLNVEDLINDEFVSQQSYFIKKVKEVPGVERFFEIEMERKHSQRFGPEYPHQTFFDEDINLYEFYNFAWDLVEQNLPPDIPQKLYLWGHEAIKQIENKYPNSKYSDDYFVRFNKVAIEEFITGAADAWYYYWLKKELAKWQNQAYKNGTPKKRKTSANAIALFCAIVNDSKQLLKGSDESKADYCKRVCINYSLTYSDNIRQQFKDGVPDIKQTSKNFKDMQSLILPVLDTDKKRPIETYLNSRTKLYN